MDVSCLGQLQVPGKEIKRKRKIQYRKSKGRLTVKTSGVLNKSVNRRTFSKSFNESFGKHSQIVSIQNVNSFLRKNKELAKALEECRQQSKDLENQKYTCQLECIEMREKLSIYQTAILRCTCGKVNIPDENTDALFQLKDNISKSMGILDGYMSGVVLHKAGIELERLSECNGPTQEQSRKYNKSVQVSIQASDNCPSTHVKSKQVKNKKVQATLMKPCDCQKELSRSNSSSDISSRRKNVLSYAPEKSTKSSVLSTLRASPLPCAIEKASKSVQCTLEAVKTRNCSIQCSLLQPLTINASEKLKSNRKPLSILKTRNSSKSQESLNEKMNNQKKICDNYVITTTRSKPFQIYEDDKENTYIVNKPSMKQQRKVTICSPANVHYYDPTPNPVVRLRPVDNKEAALNMKLRHSAALPEGRYYESPLVKPKKKIPRKKKAMKPTIAIEDIISLVEESFIAGAASITNQ